MRYTRHLTMVYQQHRNHEIPNGMSLSNFHHWRHVCLLTHRLVSSPSYYHPRTPYVTPPYYPQQPHPALDKKDLYSRMDLDTLFFIFYYRTNTYEQ